jgi:hypothetical protein
MLCNISDILLSGRAPLPEIDRPFANVAESEADPIIVLDKGGGSQRGDVVGIFDWPVFAVDHVLDGVEVDAGAPDRNRGVAPRITSFHFMTSRGTALTIFGDNLGKALTKRECGV